jgi:DNA-binding response OmpR family regulator
MADAAKQRILIVEDEPDMNNLLADVLSAFGFEPIQAGSGEQALTILSTRQPDAILLDLMLPGLSGFELCRQLKTSRETRAIPILILTALDRAIDRRYSFETGADEYLTKPFKPESLVASLKACLDRCRVAREGCSHLDLTIDLAPTLDNLKAFNMLVTCLYCLSDFTPPQMEAVRLGLVRLADLAGSWAQQHLCRPPARLRMDLDHERMKLIFTPATEGGEAFLAEHLDAEAQAPSALVDAGVIDRTTRQGAAVVLEKVLPPCGC